MLSITDPNNTPSLPEIDDFIGNPLFKRLHTFLCTTCGAKCSFAFSGDQNLPGWNLCFHKSGRTLCRLYPRVGSLLLLIVIGRREKERVEALLPKMSIQMQRIYHRTKEGMGQRWLLLEPLVPDAFYYDVETLIRIRMESK